jgi:hypothetical protein
MVGRQVNEFMVPDTSDVVARQLDALFATEEVASYGVARGPDGATFVVEWVARHHGDEIEAWFRRMPEADT